MTLTTGSSYRDTVSYDTGWFKPEFLQAAGIGEITSPTATHQVVAGRYNPNIDDGDGNEIYCTAITSTTWLPPTHDKQLLITNMPLWLGLYGYYSYVRESKSEDFWRFTCKLYLNLKPYTATQK